MELFYEGIRGLLENISEVKASWTQRKKQDGQGEGFG